MKIYTEISYKWENDSLVEISSESFEYSGEVVLCGGGGGGNPITKAVKAVASTASDIGSTVAEKGGQAVEAAQAPVSSLLTSNPLDAINVPDASNLSSKLSTGLEKLGENVGGVVQGVADPIIRNVNEAGKVIKKVVTGEGGYSDEDGGDSANGSGGGGTGSEEATGTLLTSSRKKERLMGRSYHSGGGSASTV